MKKLYGIITVVAITTILFTGCGKDQTTEIDMQETDTVSGFGISDFSAMFAECSENPTTEFTLTEIAVQTLNTRDEACHFYKDPVTDIVYMQFKGGYGDGGLVWMPDPDTGLPLKYDRFVELYEEYI